MRVPGAGCVVRVTAAVEIEAKVCVRVGCGKTLVRTVTKSDTVWDRQIYCDPTCYRFRNVAPGEEPVDSERVCRNPGCGQVLTRNRQESPSTFRRRSHCDQKCRSARIAKAAKRVSVRLVHPPVLPPPPVVAASPESEWDSPCAGSRESFWFDSTLKTKSERIAEENRLRELAVRMCGPCPFRLLCAGRGDEVKHGMYGAVLWRDERGEPTRVELFAQPSAERRAS